MTGRIGDALASATVAKPGLKCPGFLLKLIYTGTCSPVFLSLPIAMVLKSPVPASRLILEASGYYLSGRDPFARSKREGSHHYFFLLFLLVYHTFYIIVNLKCIV